MRNIVRLALSTLFMVVLAAPAFADTLLNTWGLRAGVGISNLRATNSDFDWRTAFTGGAFANMQVLPWLAVQPELLYAQKGARTSFESTDQSGNITGSGTITFKFDYIEVPVLLALSKPALGPARAAFLLGPSLGIKVAESVKSEGGGATLNAKTDVVKTANFGIVGGLGVRVPVGTLKWVGDARWSYGLTSISKQFYAGDVQTSSAQITTGVEF
jgi:Outer membrane protein beta-barrel domain